MVEVKERSIIINLSRSQSDSIMIRWSNADDVGLRNRTVGVGIPRESPLYNGANNYLVPKYYKKGMKRNDDYERRND